MFFFVENLCDNNFSQESKTFQSIQDGFGSTGNQDGLDSSFNLNLIYLIYMYKEDLALDNQQRLICHKN